MKAALRIGRGNAFEVTSNHARTRPGALAKDLELDFRQVRPRAAAHLEEAFFIA